MDILNTLYIYIYKSVYSPSVTQSGKGEGKAIPLQALIGPEGSKRLRLPFLRQLAHEGDKFVSPTHRPPLPLGNIPTQSCTNKNYS
jgi:hypothetical protein